MVDRADFMVFEGGHDGGRGCEVGGLRRQGLEVWDIPFVRSLYLYKGSRSSQD